MIDAYGPYAASAVSTLAFPLLKIGTLIRVLAGRSYSCSLW